MVTLLWYLKSAKLSHQLCHSTDQSAYARSLQKARHSGSKCQKTRQKISSPKMISRVFPCKFLQIHKTSVSGCLRFTFKNYQIVAVANMIRQSHDFLKSHFWRAFAICLHCAYTENQAQRALSQNKAGAADIFLLSKVWQWALEVKVLHSKVIWRYGNFWL